jgi:hypothetical protein
MKKENELFSWKPSIYNMERRGAGSDEAIRLRWGRVTRE